VQLSAAAHQVDASLFASTALGTPPATYAFPALTSNSHGFAIQGGLILNTDYFARRQVLAAYEKGAYSYIAGDNLGCSGACEQQWGFDIAGAYKDYWLPILSSAVYGSYLELHYPAGALAGFGGAVGVSNLKETRVGANLVWTPLKGFDIGAEFMYVHLNETRPVGLAPDSTLTATGLPAFEPNNNQYEGRLRIQRAF
jgi:hypothetical protein